jgi:hypothetical protein
MSLRNYRIVIVVFVEIYYVIADTLQNTLDLSDIKSELPSIAVFLLIDVQQ